MKKGKSSYHLCMNREICSSPSRRSLKVILKRTKTSCLAPVRKNSQQGSNTACLHPGPITDSFTVGPVGYIGPIVTGIGESGLKRAT
jgi:hypothetical protein